MLTKQDGMNFLGWKRGAGVMLSSMASVCTCVGAGLIPWKQELRAGNGRESITPLSHPPPRNLVTL